MKKNKLSIIFNKLKGQLNNRLNSSRHYLFKFVCEAAESLPENAKILDAGAGPLRYKRLFHKQSYESADFCQVDKFYGKITYVCDLTEIPVENSKYDLVLFTQVLEHVSEPLKVLKELHRVLKPGGVLYMSAPFFYEEHEIPFDFYRYTQFGFKHLLQSAGFTITKIDWLEGYCATLSYQLKKASQYLPLHPKHYGGGLIGIFASIMAILLKPLFAFLYIFFAYLDMRHKYTRTGYCTNYTVIAVKSNESKK